MNQENNLNTQVMVSEDKIVKLINENINKDTDVKYIIYMQEEFKNPLHFN